MRFGTAALRRLPPNVQGALWLVAGGFIFTTNGAMIRLLSTEIEGVQTAFFRAFFSVIFLLAGFWTRTSAVLAWVLSTSFANLNPNIDNAGDTVRGVILGYYRDVQAKKMVFDTNRFWCSRISLVAGLFPNAKVIAMVRRAWWSGAPVAAAVTS